METGPAGGADGSSWWVRNASGMKSVFRMLFGVVWLIDGALKFTSGFVHSFPNAVATARANAPSWLAGWYSFWGN